MAQMTKEEETLARLAQEIKDLWAEREVLKSEMTAWLDAGHKTRFPKLADLDKVTDQLSDLDTAYKALWDEQQAREKSVKSAP